MAETPNEVNLYGAGGPAFPVSLPGCGDNGWHGMLLRDWFAGLAMQAVCQGTSAVPAAEHAYELADAMLKVRGTITSGGRDG